MTIKSRKFTKGIRLKATDDAATIDGEIRNDKTEEVLKVNLEGAEQEIVTTEQEQTLKNKIIDGLENTITNISAGSIGDLVTDLSQPVDNTQVAGAQAIKDYVGNTASASSSDLIFHMSDKETHGVTGKLVGTTDAQTLENKEIDSATNTITIDADTAVVSNIEVDNLKAGVLDTDLVSVSATDDTLPSAKAVKTYVDDAVSGIVSDASEITYTQADPTDWDATHAHVDTGLDEIADRTKASEASISTHTSATGTKHTSDLISYDNTVSSLPATDVKLALDQLKVLADDAAVAANTTYDSSSSSLTDADVQAAIDSLDTKVEATSIASEFTYHVNKLSGSNTNDGSLLKPLQTIQAAIDAVKVDQGTGSTGYCILVDHGTYTENLNLSNAYNIMIIGKGITDSQNTTIVGTVDLTDSENIKFKSFKITQASGSSTIIIDKNTPTHPLVISGGKHHFQQCVIENTSAGQDVIQLLDGVTSYIQIRECTLEGNIDLQTMTVAGSSVSLIGCQAKDTTIECNLGQIFSAVDCSSIGTITHNGGIVRLKNVQEITRDGSNKCIISSAILSASNLVHMEDISTYDVLADDYGIIEVLACGYVINGCSRDPSIDILTGLRVDRSHRSQDIAYDNTDSGLTAVDVKSAIDEVKLLAGSGPLASETVKGIVELADLAEAIAGIDDERAITPAKLAIKANKALDDLANVAINTHLLPDTDITHDLGSNTLRFRDLYLSGASLHLGDLKFTENAGKLIIEDVNNPGTPALSTDDLIEGVTNLFYTDGAAVALNTAKVGITPAQISEVAANTAHSADVTTNPHAVTKAQVGLENVVNIDTTNASNITTGTLPSSVIPPVALTSVQEAASEVIQLALTTEEGDVVVRTDEVRSYMRNSGTAGTMADFTELQTPIGTVLSVNTQTGVVVLTATDVGLGNADDTSDADKPVSTATQTALDLKSDATHIHDDIYFQESEHINVTTGAPDAGKPIKLDASGVIDPSMYTNTAGTTDHTALTNIGTKTHATIDSEIDANNAKVSYTDAAAVALNTAKISYTDSAAVALNTAKVSYTDAAAVALNTAKVSDINHVTIDLPNVDNTSDADKPVSTATQTALDLKGDDVVTTRGDIVRGDALGDAERLAIGVNGQVLTSDGTDVSWSTPDSGVTDHTLLSNIGTKTHATIDSEIAINNAKISYTDAAAVALNTAKVSYTDSAAVALNTAKVSYTDAAAVALNTDKVGITPAQALEITANTAKVSYDDSAAVALNTAKISYTDAAAVALNTAKVGITPAQASDITTNNAKVSYTDSAAVAANTAKISYTDSAAVTANTAKISYTDAAAVALNTAKVGITPTQASDITDNKASVGDITALGTPTNYTTSSEDEVAARLAGIDTALASAGGGGASSSFDINQTTHGLAVGDGIHHNGTIFVKSQADDAATLAYYVVVEVTDVDNFTATDMSRIVSTAHGFTIGEFYWLSDSVAGTPTITEPSSGFSNPLFYVEDANTLQVKCYRPDAIQGINLDDLDDVAVPTPTDGQVLTYDNTNSRWEPTTPAAVDAGVASASNTIANNQSAEANLTGLIFDSSITRSASLEYSCHRKGTVVAPDFIIVGIMDGPSASGSNKTIVFKAGPSGVADISIYGIAFGINGGADPVSPGFTFPAISASADQFIYVTLDQINHTAFFGFAADHVAGISSNGDDTLLLFQNGSVLIDRYGRPDQDGTGQDWEFTDGWAYRNNDTSPSANFNVGDWVISGTGALDAATNAACSIPMPVGTFTSSGSISDNIEMGKIFVSYRDSVTSWSLTNSIDNGIDVNVAFTIDATTGQLKYTSHDLSDTAYSGKLVTFTKRFEK